MRILASALVLMVFESGATFASAPDISARPMLRPASVEPATSSVKFTEAAPKVSLRPRARVKSPDIGQKQTVKRNPVAINQAAHSRPKKRGLFQKLKDRRNNGSGRTAKGSVCGVNAIKGVEIPSIPGRLKGCGVQNPVKVSSVAGVTLSQHSIMDCTTAKALHSWIETGVKPTVKRKGGGVKSLQIAAHYNCRTRNNRKGARISEHGRGRAIDISAIILENGTSLTVLRDWRSRNRKMMARLHRTACGPFGTVLGPKSDRFHQDHFHFDTARYRSGPYCR